MARWLPVTEQGEPLAGQDAFEAPDRDAAVVHAIGRWPKECFGVVSVLSWELTQERLAAQKRARRHKPTDDYKDSEVCQDDDESEPEGA